MKFLKKIIKNLPSFMTALVFAVAVWIFAVTQSDPTQTRAYPSQIDLEIFGLDPNLMIVNDINDRVTLTVRAPASILDQLENDSSLITAVLDLSGLEAGVHTLTPQVNIGLSPAEVVRLSPATVYIKLDTVITREFPILIKMIGNPTIGFEVQEPELSAENVTISGPKTLVDSIDQVLGEVSVVDASEDIQRTVDLVAYDEEGQEVEGISITPDSIEVLIPVTQRGGYRTVVVKIVTSGQIAAGYRLTNIYSMPPTVTIFSSDPTLVESIPGFIETTPINLNGASESLEIRVALNLPEGLNVVGSQNVTVQIGIEPIESSISFSNIAVQTEGLQDGLTAIISPQFVDVFLSGPLNLLEQLDPTTLLVVIDLADRGPGTYQLAPEVILENGDVQVDAILPNTIEVTIVEGNGNQGGSITPTPTVTPTTTP